MERPPRLEHIHVDRLFGLHTVDLDLSDEQHGPAGRLRIIFDDNGRGKTTVLRAVHHLLSWVDLDYHLAALAELPLDGIELKLGDTSVTFCRDADDPRACTVEVAPVDGDPVRLEFDPARDDPRAPYRLILDRSLAANYREVLAAACPPPILVSDDRVIRGDDLLNRRTSRYRTTSGHQRDRAPVSREQQRADRLERRDPSEELRMLLDMLSQTFLQAAYSSPTSPGIDAVYADMVSRIASDKVKEAAGDVEALQMRAQQIERDLELAVRHGFVGLSQLRQVETTLSGLRKNSRNKKMIATVLEPFFSTLESDAEHFGPIAARVDLLISTVNGFLTDKSLRYSLRDGLQIHPSEDQPDPSPLDPLQLSSGERHLLLLIGSAMIADSGRLILIDEPELSLGIPWKRKLLSALLDLTGDAQVQFLVASHSVEIISPYHSRAVALHGSDG